MCGAIILGLILIYGFLTKMNFLYYWIEGQNSTYRYPLIGGYPIYFVVSLVVDLDNNS